MYKIKVLIVDDSEQTRENIQAIFDLEKEIEVAGNASNGRQAVELAKQLKPDIILMDINMPEMDGIKATEAITESGLESPIIMMSIQGEKEYIKKAMTAGAREYIMKPFGVKELTDTIKRVYQVEQNKKKKSMKTLETEKIDTKIISVFSTKGGVGKTTIATNLAVATANATRKKVVLLDFDLQFGDVAICLNLYVKNTITELVSDLNNIEQEPYLIEEYLLAHYSGIKVLAAPLKPENAEYVTAEHIKRIIEILRGKYDYIIIDTPQGFNDVVITTLDLSDSIIYVSTLDLPSIKNTKNGLEIMKSLNYSTEKVKIIINKSNESFGIKINDFKKALNVDISEIIPEDLSAVTVSVNNGHPLVSHRKSSIVSKRINRLAVGMTQR